MSFAHLFQTGARRPLGLLGAALVVGSTFGADRAQAQSNITDLFIELGTLAGNVFTPNLDRYDTQDQIAPVSEIFVVGVSSNASVNAPLLNAANTNINVPGSGAYNLYLNPGGGGGPQGGLRMTVTFGPPLSSAYVIVFRTNSQPVGQLFQVVSTTPAPAAPGSFSARFNPLTFTVNRVGTGDNLNPAGTSLDEIVELFLVAPDDPLPVELQSFSGAPSRDAVKLSWATASERENAGFAVIRDGVEIASFRSTSSLAGQGTTSQEARYTFTDTRVRVGESYVYKLRSFDRTGEVHDLPHTVRVELTGKDVTPNAFALRPAQPNPFNPTTQIPFDLPEAARVTAIMYNALGQPVRVVISGDQRGAGKNQVASVNGEGLSSGVYMVRMTAVGVSGTVYSQTQRVVLAK